MGAFWRAISSTVKVSPCWRADEPPGSARERSAEPQVRTRPGLFHSHGARWGERRAPEPADPPPSSRPRARVAATLGPSSLGGPQGERPKRCSGRHGGAPVPALGEPPRRAQPARAGKSPRSHDPPAASAIFYSPDSPRGSRRRASLPASDRDPGWAGWASARRGWTEGGEAGRKRKGRAASGSGRV